MSPTTIMSPTTWWVWGALVSSQYIPSGKLQSVQERHTQDLNCSLARNQFWKFCVGSILNLHRKVEHS